MIDEDTLNRRLTEWTAGTGWKHETGEQSLPPKVVWDDGRTRVRVAFILDSGVTTIELSDLTVGGAVVLDVDCHHEYGIVLEALTTISKPVPSKFRPLAESLLAHFPLYDNDGEQSHPIDAAFLANLPG